MITLRILRCAAPNKADVFEEDRCKQACSYLVWPGVIYIEIGRRIQVAAIQNIACQGRRSTALRHM